MAERAADHPAWLTDPSPSWDETAQRAGVDLDLAADTPEGASGCLETLTAKLWPVVPAAAQEVRADG